MIFGGISRFQLNRREQVIYPRSSKSNVNGHNLYTSKPHDKEPYILSSLSFTLKNLLFKSNTQPEVEEYNDKHCL